MFKAAERICDFGGRLPMAPERIAYFSGIFALCHAMTEIEFGNPLIGGIETIVGALTITASLNTKEAIETIDNRGNM